MRRLLLFVRTTVINRKTYKLETADGFDAKTTCANSTRSPGIRPLLVYAAFAQTHMYTLQLYYLRTPFKTYVVLERIQSKQSTYFWYFSRIFSCLLRCIINHRMSARRDKLDPLLNLTDCRSPGY